jgi:hypothetical protein
MSGQLTTIESEDKELDGAPQGIHTAHETTGTSS